MKLSTNYQPVTPYFLFMQQVSDNVELMRSVNTGTEVVPLQFAGIYGQEATLEDRTIVEITSFDGRESGFRQIAPTLRS